MIRELMMTMIMMTTKEISSGETYVLRHLILWPHIKNTEDCTIDIDEREDAIHLGTFVGDRLISVCSLFAQKNSKIDSGKQYRLRAMATHPDFRGRNAGKMLVEFAVELLKSRDYDFLWCDAREVALGFYGKLGFEVVGDWYEVMDVGRHKTMVFSL